MMNEHDNVITAAMLLANIKNAVDCNDEEFLTKLAERADDPYTSMLLEYCDALADAFIENATLNESAGDDDILLAEDMEELLEIFGLRTADKNHLVNYDDAVSRNARYKENLKKFNANIAGLADSQSEEKSRKTTGDEYNAVMKNNGLANALRRRSLLFGYKTDEERQKSVDADIQKNHLKAAAHRARMTRLGADFNYLKDRFGKNGAYKTAIRDTKDAVKKDLAAAKYAYKHEKGDDRYRLKMQYKDLKAQNGGLWRNRAMRRQMKADLNAHRADVKRNTGVIAFKNQRTGKQDYAVANLRAVKDQITGKTSAQPSVKTYGGDGKYAGLDNKNLASTMNVGKSKNLDTINNKLPNSINPDSPMNNKPQTDDGTAKNLAESYDFYAYALLESNGWVPSEDNKNTLMSEGVLVLSGYDAMFEGTDEFILAELLDLNGFEVTESNIKVLAEALDSGSAMIDFEKKTLNEARGYVKRAFLADQAFDKEYHNISTKRLMDIGGGSTGRGLDRIQATVENRYMTPTDKSRFRNDDDDAEDRLYQKEMGHAAGKALAAGDMDKAEEYISKGQSSKADMVMNREFERFRRDTQRTIDHQRDKDS